VLRLRRIFLQDCRRKRRNRQARCVTYFSTVP